MSTTRYSNSDELRFKKVDEYQFVDENIFRDILLHDKPAILKNCYFGSCMQNWSLEYLNDKLKDESVVIHESVDSNLDFIGKNFKYQTCLFSQFAQKLKSQDSKLNVYLRSTNGNPRAKEPARIENDFPSISQDLQPPIFIPFKEDNELYHSSVLRIASSNVQIWTHFDLYQNVLCQVSGTKRIILFHPFDTKYLYVQGDKSSVNDFDNWESCLSQFPLIEKAKPHKCLLKPGDTLFIPTLWWHNIRTISESSSDNSYSIGFNIFWKDQNLDSKSMYADRDVYGNKNLKPFDSALANLDRAIQLIEKMPDKYKIFYKLMLFEKMQSKLSL